METRLACRALVVCLAFAAGIGASRTAHAQVCTVSDRADNAAVPNTLRWCVGQVNSGVSDQIDIVQSGIYHLETPLQIDRDVDVAAIGPGVVVQPGETFQDDTLIRVGCGAIACAPVVSITNVQIWSGLAPGWRGIDVRAGSVLTLDRVIVADFDTTLDGGALRARDGTLVHLLDSEILGNRGARGGAVFSSGQLLEVIDCRFENNRASSEGGAIHFRMSPFIAAGHLQVDTSELVGNQTMLSGGAVFVTGSPTLITASIAGSLLTGNQAAVRGGALDGFADVSLSTFASNRAQEGGGLSLLATSRVIDSVISSNQALRGGGISFRTTSTQTGLILRGSTLGKNDFARQNGAIGAGIYLSGGKHLIENTTLSTNGAPATVMAVSTTGGGLAMSNAVAELRHATLERNAADTGGGLHVNSLSTLAVSSSIVADSQIGTDCSILGTSSQTTSLSTDTSCSFTYRTSPQLGPIASNGGPTPTHMPAPASPVIDRGTCFAAVDQRGRPRPGTAGTLCDIGSVEVR